MNEIWKDIKGYNGKYQVSNIGRVRSIATGRWKLLNIRFDRYGYQRFSVAVTNENGTKSITYLLHRAVAEAFIPNPYDLETVNHKDFCKTNNTVGNLEWCSRSYNSIHWHTRNKSIYISNKKTGRIYKTIKEASEDLGINYRTLCSSIRNNKNKHVEINKKYNER